jgi:hypothetical protein
LEFEKTKPNKMLTFCLFAAHVELSHLPPAPEPRFCESGCPEAYSPSRNFEYSVNRGKRDEMACSQGLFRGELFKRLVFAVQSPSAPPGHVGRTISRIVRAKHVRRPAPCV